MMDTGQNRWGVITCLRNQGKQLIMLVYAIPPPLALSHKWRSGFWLHRRYQDCLSPLSVISSCNHLKAQRVFAVLAVPSSDELYKENKRELTNN
jgi:hypothetical protein